MLTSTECKTLNVEQRLIKQKFVVIFLSITTSGVACCVTHVRHLHSPVLVLFVQETIEISKNKTARDHLPGDVRRRVVRVLCHYRIEVSTLEIIPC